MPRFESSCSATNRRAAKRVLHSVSSFTHPSAGPHGDGLLCRWMNARLCRRLNHDRGKFSISQNPLSRWQNAYQAALWELDRKKLLERVTAAETAIFNRIQALL